MVSDYTVEQQLRKGVFRARHRTTQQSVTLRFHDSPLGAQVIHPLIVPVVEQGMVDGEHYSVLAQIGNRTLEDVLEEVQLPWRDAVYAVRQIGVALSYAHHRGVIHQNLHAGAIVVDEYANLYVSDFGLPVMPRAPEQWQRLEPTPQTDIYALGCLLYQITTGRLPFAATDISTLRWQHVHQQAPAPIRATEARNDALIDMINRAMAKNPADRYHSVWALVTDFARAVGVPLPDAQPVTLGSAVQPVPIWSTRPQFDASPQPLIALDRDAAGLQRIYAARDGLYEASDRGLQWLTRMLGITAVAIDGDHIMTTHVSGCLRFDGVEVDAHDSKALCCAAEAGCVVSGGEDGLLIIWDERRMKHIIDADDGAVLACQLSFDGRLALAGYASGSLRLFDTQNGTLVQHYQLHQAPITACGFDGGVMISGDADGVVIQWDILQASSPILLTDFAKSVRACAVWVSPDDQLTVVADATQVRCFRGGSKQLYTTYDFPQQTIHAIKLLSGDTLEVASDAGLTRCNIANRAHHAKIDCMIAAADSILSAAADGTVHRYAAADGRLLQTWAHQGQVTALETVGDDLIVGTADGMLRCWRDQACLWEAEAHLGAVNFILSVDAKRIVTGGADGRLAIWARQDGTAVSRVGVQSANLRCAVRHQGQVVIGTQEGLVAGWDVQRGVQVKTYAEYGMPVTALAVIDGRLLVGLADGVLARLGGKAYAISPAPLVALSGRAEGVVCLGADHQAVTWYADETAAPWNRPLTAMTHSGQQAMGDAEGQIAVYAPA